MAMVLLKKSGFGIPNYYLFFFLRLTVLKYPLLSENITAKFSSAISMKSRSLSEDKLLIYGGISEFHSLPVRKNYVKFGSAGLGRNQDSEIPIKHQNKLRTCSEQ